MLIVSSDDGLLRFACESPAPRDIAAVSPETSVFGQHIQIDHFVLTLPDADRLWAFAEELKRMGGEVVEGPGLWPRDFCGDGDAFPDDLQMHFASVLLATMCTVVLAAPHADGDQLARFRATRGTGGIHHVALRVEDAVCTRQLWQARGFSPLSGLLDDGQLVQQFLCNGAGQIIEMIGRRGAGSATFSCANLAGLRRSEGGGK